MVMWPAMLVGQTPIPSQMMTSTSFWNITLSQMPSTSFLEMLLAGAAFSIIGSLTISLGLSTAKKRMKAFVSHVCSLPQATVATATTAMQQASCMFRKYPDPAEDPVYPAGNILHCWTLIQCTEENQISTLHSTMTQWETYRPGPATSEPVGPSCQHISCYWCIRLPPSKAFRDGQHLGGWGIGREVRLDLDCWRKAIDFHMLWDWKKFKKTLIVLYYK